MSAETPLHRSLFSSPALMKRSLSLSATLGTRTQMRLNFGRQTQLWLSAGGAEREARGAVSRERYTYPFTKKVDTRRRNRKVET